MPHCGDKLTSGEFRSARRPVASPAFTTQEILKYTPMRTVYPDFLSHKVWDPAASSGGRWSNHGIARTKQQNKYGSKDVHIHRASRELVQEKVSLLGLETPAKACLVISSRPELAPPLNLTNFARLASMIRNPNSAWIPLHAKKPKHLVQAKTTYDFNFVLRFEWIDSRCCTCLIT